MAAAKGILFVPGVGATPGITNMMARRASESLEQIEAIEVYFAAFRCLAPAPGLLQTTLWEFNPEVKDRDAVYFEGGDFRPAAPLQGGKAVRFHDQIGEQTVYYVPHPEPRTFLASFPGLRRAAVRGCFPPHVMETMVALTRAGLLSGRKVYPGGKKSSGDGVESIEAVRAVLAESPFSLENPVWAYGLVVEVSGRKSGEPVTAIYRSHHPPQDVWGGSSAYYKNVGIPLSIGAQLIGSGQVNGYGVLPPEQAFQTEPSSPPSPCAGSPSRKRSFLGIEQAGLVVKSKISRGATL
jgi:saccharopine dehydrogenase-like NADP-dependent oxidoreductase